MQGSQKLTIVLTLKDRVPFTYRWMKYMDDVRCPYRILIADGGEEGGAIEQHLRKHENYPNLDYDYIRYPYDATIEIFYEKFVNVLSRVESEYLLLADNDDFFLLERIPDMLVFLDARKDYVGARGKRVDFTLFDKIGKSNNLVTGVRYFAWSREERSIESASPFDRVEALCKDMLKYDHYSNWYCIFRSAPLQEVWRSLITLPVKEVLVTEVLTHILMLMRGKIGILPYPFYFRQSHTSTLSATLNAGNTFLERCMVNNALADLGLAIDRFVSVENKEERDRLLKAIAAWLESIVLSMYSSRDMTSLKSRWRAKLNRYPLLGPWTYSIYYRIAHLFLPRQQINPVRMKAIEPYILSS